MIDEFTCQNSVKRNLNRFTKNLIPLAIIVAAIIIGGVLVYTSPSLFKEKKEEGVLTSQEVGEKVINFFNENILEEQATAVLIDMVEESGLYKLNINIEDNELALYATRDGKLLFSGPVDLDQEPSPSSEEENGTPEETPKAEAPNVKLFIMSFCPYGNQAEELMALVVELLGNKVNIEPHYVVYSNYGGGGPNFCLDEENKYCSMHGIQELNQGVRELCVYKYQKDKFWDFLKEINKNCSSQNADTCWETVAQNMGIDVQKIKDCQENEALNLLATELSLNKKYGVGGSPQLFINDVEYKGQRSSDAYKSAICSAFEEPPEECEQALNSSGNSVPSGGCE